MKLILYFGHTGTTKKAAELLKENLEDAYLADGTKKLKLDYSAVDMIIFGTNIHMEKPHKALIKMLKKLKKKNLSIPYHGFVVAANQSEKIKYMHMLKELLGEEAWIGFFGGELNPEGAKGITRLVIQSCIQKLVEQDLSLPSLDELAIKSFAEAIK